MTDEELVSYFEAGTDTRPTSSAGERSSPCMMPSKDHDN